jgi:hypothetical protein
MKPALAFLAGLSVFPLAALVLWALTRRGRVDCIVPDLDPEKLRRAQEAQAMVDDALQAVAEETPYRFSMS